MSSTLTTGGKDGIRSEFDRLTSAELAGASDKASSVRLIKLKQMSKVFFIDNSTNTDIAFWVSGPEHDPGIKHLWVVVPAGKMVNFELASNNLMISAGTSVFCSYEGVVPTSGSVCMFSWG